MVVIQFEFNNRKRLRDFKSPQDALKFLRAKGYEYDVINGYYWKVDAKFGWLTKARVVNH